MGDTSALHAAMLRQLASLTDAWSGPRPDDGDIESQAEKRLIVAGYIRVRRSFAIVWQDGVRAKITWEQAGSWKSDELFDRLNKGILPRLPLERRATLQQTHETIPEIVARCRTSDGNSALADSKTGEFRAWAAPCVLDSLRVEMIAGPDSIASAPGPGDARPAEAAASKDATTTLQRAERSENNGLPSSAPVGEAEIERAARAMMVMDGEAAGIAAIAANHLFSVDQRMSAIIDLDVRFEGKLSTEWAALLNTTDSSVRQTRTWKGIRKRQKLID